MPSASGERHCDDEALVAYLDRELEPADRESVEQHLGACWDCRMRAAEMERDIHAITRMIEAESSSSGEEVKRALRTFLARRVRYEAERERPISSKRALLRVCWPPLPWAAAGAALAGVIAAALLWHEPRALAPEPRAIVVRAAESERALSPVRQASHQVLRVEAGTADLGTVEIWSEGARYSSRWTDARNRLKYAVWKPTPASAYAYDSEARRAVPCGLPAGAAHLADWFQNADAASLERTFLKWMQSRSWKLVSFAGEWAAFADRTGVRLTVERLRVEKRDLWRLSAARAEGGRTFEVVLHVDAGTFAPQLQAVRITENGRVAEIRLTVDRWQPVSPLELQPVVFTPGPSIPIFEKSRPPLVLPPAPAPPVAVPWSLPEWALTDLELRLRWALHEALLCVDVSVTRAPGAGLTIRPLVSDSALREALARIVATIEGSAHIRIEPATDSVAGHTSHVAMIGKHARLLEEIAGQARQIHGLSGLQERELGRLFADHRRGLRLELAHLKAQIEGGHPPSLTEVSDIATAPGYLVSEEARALISSVRQQAAALAASSADQSAALWPLDGNLTALETSMRSERAVNRR